MLANQNIEEQVESLLLQMTLKEKVSLLSGRDVWNTMPVERLGIPALTMTDGPSGVRATSEDGRIPGPTTAFPTGTSLGATWNPALIQQVGAAMAEETLAMGCDILLGPCVNIIRHPLAGRNFETYSEDPFLAGFLGAAWVKGLQSQGVGASLKHFACNNQEVERMRGNSVVDERTLREIYLGQFERVVKETQPWTVMCAYNRVNGEYASQNKFLLDGILRQEWGFTGVVVSDWGANHTIFESMDAGLDIEMPGPAKYYGLLLMEAVQNWQIEEETINQAVRRILRMLVQSGRMAPGYQRPTGSVNTPEHQRLAQHVAEEAITLLKNESGLLPLELSNLKRVAVIGQNAARLVASGGGSSFVVPPCIVSPLEALQARLGEDVDIEYAPGCDNFVELPVIRPENLGLPGGSGRGLQGEYFSEPGFNGAPVITRADEKMDFYWFSKGPTGQPGYAVRWTGRLSIPQSGRYTLKVNHTAACRVYLDGALVIDSQAPEQIEANPNQVAVVLNLKEGKEVGLRIEYIKDNEDTFANFRLLFAETPLPEDDHRFEAAVEAARRADVALVFAGEVEGYEHEGDDRPHLHLPGEQEKLIQAVADANSRTVVILNAGAPVVMPWLESVPAVLLAYFPGMEGGNALAKILLGEANPSGKLPVTYPQRLEDTPAYLNYPGERDVFYGEGIFVGYRYYDQRGIEPLFPFGHGLSYTTFAYSDLQAPEVVRPGEPVPVSVSIWNTGPVAGKEAVQLYIHDPSAALPRPPQELKGFQKIELQAGQAQTLHFNLEPRLLAYYDPDQGRWIAEPGEFEIRVGSSSRDIRLRRNFTMTVE